MPKRYGITNNPDKRMSELNNQYHGFENFEVLEKFPTKAAAQAWEQGKPNAHPGGANAKGPYYGYSHNYSRKK